METESFELLHWCPEPYPEESIASYLVRLRSQEIAQISAPSSLSQAIGLGIALTRWEKFRFNPFPSTEEIEKFCNFVGLEVEQFNAMLPPEGERMKLEPIRLCAACYAEKPFHRLNWQFQSTAGCNQHRLRLLSKCPGCEKPFSIPLLIQEKQCKCGMYFRKMAKYQKPF
ncbi:MAG TPA: TniQ family protein [Allocoleopsis sp.]